MSSERCTRAMVTLLPRKAGALLAAALLIAHFPFLLSSCSSPDDVFTVKGKFKNFNQGELYVYGLAGRGSIDTVRLSEGRFTYDVLQEDTALLSVVFPNFSEIPVIAVPGGKVDMQGDASHLREVTVNGTKDNELLTKLRLDVAAQTPPEALKTAEAFIRKHPASPACLYVLNRFFLARGDADYGKSAELLALMAGACPHNRYLRQLRQQTEALRTVRKTGQQLPAFHAVSISGRRVTNDDLRGELNIVSAWASWDVASQNIQRELRRLQKDYGGRLKIVGVCLDANREECRQKVERDSLLWPIVCDGRMWDTPVVSQLGLTTVPELILTDRSGRIVERHLPLGDLRRKVEERLGKARQ